MTTLLQSAQTNKIPYSTGINGCYNQINFFVLNLATYFQKASQLSSKNNKKVSDYFNADFF
ncbi:hypothetical protein FC16_GL000955 [Loigolactobacillus coryniformis subsp. torquens DSM 20004 = KCTC 3535]|nr:hypothetical protein FC16_GL000955 [Loigolactobacillus coryniformis subsp. torquens DSM 20004 = KCTC 3535]